MADERMDAKRRAQEVTPQSDLRMSEGYETYFDEELRPLLKEKKGHTPEDQLEEQKAKKRRKLLSKYNRMGALILSANDLKRRALTGKTAAAAAAEDALLARKGKEQEAAENRARRLSDKREAVHRLSKELELKDLESQREEPLAHLSLSGRPAPPPAPPAARAVQSMIPVSGDDQRLQMAAGLVQHHLNAVVGRLQQTKYACAEPGMLCDAGAAFEEMVAITSQARGDEKAASRRGEGRRESAAAGEDLVVYSTGDFLMDTKVPKQLVTMIQTFTESVVGYLRFYWSCFPPSSLKVLKKMKGISKALLQFHQKIVGFKAQLNANNQAPLAMMLKPVQQSIQAVFATQKQVDDRVAKRNARKRARAAANNNASMAF